MKVCRLRCVGGRSVHLLPVKPIQQRPVLHEPPEVLHEHVVAVFAVATAAHMGGDGAVGRVPQGTGGRQGLVGEHVQRSSADPTAVEGGDQARFVDDAASSDVDETGPSARASLQFVACEYRISLNVRSSRGKFTWNFRSEFDTNFKLHAAGNLEITLFAVMG